MQAVSLGVPITWKKEGGRCQGEVWQRHNLPLACREVRADHGRPNCAHSFAEPRQHRQPSAAACTRRCFTLLRNAPEAQGMIGTCWACALSTANVGVQTVRAPFAIDAARL